jgi:RNA-splicing ligase RtcB
MFEVTGKYTTAKVMIDDVEESCVAQINHFVNHPAFTNPIAIMPDTHAGKGSVIGFTMPMSNRLIPNVVGVDIGCGMLSMNIGKHLPLSLELIDHKIRQRVPFGMETHDKAIINMETQFPWHQANVLAQKFSLAYRKKFDEEIHPPVYNMNWFMGKIEKIRAGGMRRFINSIGTLGGGNHFTELGLSDTEDHWVTIHTGSRNFGKCICEYWQGIASKSFNKETHAEHLQKIEDLKNTLKGRELFEAIKTLKGLRKPGIDMKGCEWLEGEEAHGYLFDMLFAQKYAEENRLHIAHIICDILGINPTETIETVHNFIDFQDFIIRKGSIRSYVDERVIIPFNMRDGILICEGKSNPEWNCSAPHGAGRLMSRGQAKREINLEEFKDQMKDIYSTSVGTGTLDEAPGAYKPARIIEEAIGPTATIIGRIKPILNMKDSKGDDN